MAQYRSNLPQLGDELFLTDAGAETFLIFTEGHDLPEFAAFDLLKDVEGRAALEKYFRTFAEMARHFKTNLILESITWRANSDWARRIGYSSEQLAEANRRSIELLEQIRSEFQSEQTKIVISGCVGPRGDGYVPGELMSAKEAEDYHFEQIKTFADTAADMISGFTINYVEEAIGITEAARRANMPVIISFTVETDGKLPGGQSLKSAIEQVDAATASYPAYYMINCAHPTHFEHTITSGEPWIQRIMGIRANASCKSHAELNECTVLDDGNPAELGAQYARLKEMLPRLTVIGGCCGTDHRHVEKMAECCVPLF